jgi:hypothetical protein
MVAPVKVTKLGFPTARTLRLTLLIVPSDADGKTQT